MLLGTLKLDLAQYREIAAFAKFGSDLDEETQEQLNRGEKLVEMLKQPQYSPMTMEQEIFIVYAGIAGFLNDVDLSDISKFELRFISFMKEVKLLGNLFSKGSNVFVKEAYDGSLGLFKLMDISNKNLSVKLLLNFGDASFSL